MIKCPNCKKSGVDLVHRNEEKGTLKYRCRFCKWTETAFIARPNVRGEDHGDGRIMLMIPENIGMCTKKLVAVGNSQYVIIDRKMMEAAGVEIGDLVHVLIWSVDFKGGRGL